MKICDNKLTLGVICKHALRTFSCDTFLPGHTAFVALPDFLRMVRGRSATELICL